VVTQGGLLDIALHPKFNENSWVYVTYAKHMNGEQTTALARAKLDLAKEEFSEWQDIFLARPTFTTAHHYGSRIAFDDKGYLFLTVGDRGQDKLAQSLKTHNGKVLRLNMDGSAPNDNPFVNQTGALKEIWSYGHRNPQGLFFDKQTGTLYEQEHGPMGGDEINHIVKGKNYGWPLITYGREYTGGPVGDGETARDGLEQPIKYFLPSIAPSGLVVYRSKKLKLFKDRFISGALALQHLNVIDIKDCSTACEDRLLLPLNERIRDVIAGPDGLVYASSDTGRIYRIQEGQ
jgi:glucose/arabinose dehydrogenase